jgi:hypothetical protein
MKPPLSLSRDSSSLAAAVNRAANRNGRTTPPTSVGKPGSGSAGAQFNQQADDGFDEFDPRGADFKAAPPAGVTRVGLSPRIMYLPDRS